MVYSFILTDKSRPVTSWLVLQGLICKNVFKFFCSLSCHLHANIPSALLNFDYIQYFIFGILQIQHVKGSQRAWFWCSVLTTLTILYILFCVESNKVPLVNFPKTTWLLALGQLFLACAIAALVVLFEEVSPQLVLPLREVSSVLQGNDFYWRILVMSVTNDSHCN